MTFSADAKIYFKKFKKKIFDHKKLKKTPQKVAYLWQLGGFFLCSPDCPKQPGTSFPFYKFFYPIVSAEVSDSTIVQNLYFKIFYNKNYQISRNVLFLFVLNTVNLLNTPLSVISADFLFYQTNQFYIK